MKKVLAGALFVLAVVLGSLGTMSAAQAYPDITPPTSVSPPTVSQGGPAVSGASGAAPGTALPSTGGPNGALLLGGVALLVVGAGATVASRRRQSD